MRNRPIGLYDSGIGGLSVLRHVARLLPRERLIYVADTARVPYGGRSDAEIIRYNEEILNFLAAKGCKVAIAACNTSSALALPIIASTTPLPVLGLIEAGAQLAVPYRRVAVIATEGTIRSGAYERAIARLNPHVQVISLACPDFVPLVESGEMNSKHGRAIVRNTLQPLLGQGVEALILGCTHYPYLAPLLMRSFPGIRLLDPGEAIAYALMDWLRRNEVEETAKPAPPQLYTTGHLAPFETQVGRMYDMPALVTTLDLQDYIQPLVANTSSMLERVPS